MFTTKARTITAKLSLTAVSLAVAGLGIAAPAAQASTTPAGGCEFNIECPVTFSSGQHLRVLYGNSPLRACHATSCRVIAYMPATKSLKPGGGWVTSKANQNAGNAWCIIDYRGITGWTGCGRLSS